MSAIWGELASLKNSIKQLVNVWTKGVHKIHEAVQGKHRTNHDADSSQNPNVVSVPTVIKVIDGVEIHKSTDDKNQESEYKKRTLRWQKYTFWAVFIYAGITAYSAYLTREITKENRAWVGASAFNVGSLLRGQNTLGPIIPNTPVHANFVFENFGRTPAKIEGIGMKLEVRRKPVPEDYVYENEKPGTVVFPTKTAQSTDVMYALSDTEFTAVKSNDGDKWEKGILVLHGIVRYRDLWGKHFTKVCILWRPSGPNGKDFNNCLEHDGTE